MTRSFRLNLRVLTTELFTGAFGPMTPNDRTYFLDAQEGTLIGDVKRGNYVYRCLFSPTECQFECYESAENNDDPRCWQVCTTTGEIREM